MENSRLVRGIYRWDVVALIINATIGAGILGLPSRVYGLLGGWSLLAFPACGLVVALLIACFAEMSGRFETTGGPYVYARETFGPLVGFEIGWLAWLARLTGFATIGNLLVSYVAFFWPAATAPAARIGVIAAVVLPLSIINFLGVRPGARTSTAFTIAKLAPLTLFVIVGLFFVDFSQAALAPPLTRQGFSGAVFLLIFAFSGFELGVIPAGEVDRPRTNLPFAMFVGIGTVTLLYTAIQLVCIGTLPALATSERPLADAAQQFMGTAGASLFSGAAIVSLLGTLSATILVVPRLPFAMAEAGQLPAWFATTHPRYRSPHVSIVISTVAIFLITLFTNFTQALTISTMARLLTYAATCAAVPVLRRRSDVAPTTFRLPLGPLIPIVSLVLIAVLLAQTTAREARNVALAAGVGLVVYAVQRFRASRPESSARSPSRSA